MTYEKKLYDLHLKFMDEYDNYSKAAIEIAKKMANGVPVSAEDHKMRETLYNTFIEAFSAHKKLQQFVLENKIDPKKEVQG